MTIGAGSQARPLRRRRLGLALGALAGVGILPASALASTVPVSGAINGRCSVGTANSPFSISVTGQTAPTGSRVITSAVAATCNGASQISISATALRLVPAIAPQNSRSQTINYRASVSGWSSTAATVTTAETTPIVAVPVKFSGSPVPQLSAKSVVNLTITADRFTVINNNSVNGNNGNLGNGNGNGSGSNTKPENGTYSSIITISITTRV